MKKKDKKKAIVLGGLGVLAFASIFLLYCHWCNNALEINQFTVKSEKLPDSFIGFRIAQISDLHNTEFGEDNKKLLSMLKKAAPDIIAITGDSVDASHTDMDITLDFVRKAVGIAPCYYVTGNHEASISDYQTLEDGLKTAGVTVLHNESIQLEKNKEHILLIGLDDPRFNSFDDFYGDTSSLTSNILEKLTNNNSSFTILLSHRPELFEIYGKHHVDLVLSGHAHGGQIRLPVIGGLLAPNQGLFPKYDSGLYKSPSTNMIVSRGLGNSTFPFRINNRPEILLIELSS